MNFGVVETMIIVQHQHIALPDVAQFLEQRLRQQLPRREVQGACQGEGLLSEFRDLGLQRRDNIAEEAAQLAIFCIQRHPGAWTLMYFQPLTHQGAFAITGWGRNEGQGALSLLGLQLFQQVLTGDEILRQRRSIEFCAENVEFLVWHGVFSKDRIRNLRILRILAYVKSLSF